VRGLNPVVNGSGISEKALINPFRFFCLNIRNMNASTEVAITFSACITTIPVIDSARFGNVRRSTTKMRDVILKMPPDAYNFILSLVSQFVSVPLIDAYFVGIDDLQTCSRSTVSRDEFRHVLPHERFFSRFRSNHNHKVLVYLIGF
jgi:hypothetical protein